MGKGYVDHYIPDKFKPRLKIVTFPVQAVVPIKAAKCTPMFYFQL